MSVLIKSYFRRPCCVFLTNKRRHAKTYALHPLIKKCFFRLRRVVGDPTRFPSHNTDNGGSQTEGDAHESV
jgi:hypothetical protein